MGRKVRGSDSRGAGSTLKFHAVPIEGAWLIDSEPIEDERGFFARTFCQEEFSRRGLKADVSQCSLSFNRVKGTLRGMHVQRTPHTEAKLVRCNQGAIHDVIVDLRPASSSYMRWFAVELRASDYQMLYGPEGVAHGFQTLEDRAEVFYQISSAYRPESSVGIRWNDPAFAIKWPLPVSVISARDRSYPDWTL